jgi:chromosome segregation ATPase
VAALETKLQQVEQKNAELTARLEIRERINGALVNQLENENRRLQEERERLQKELQELEEKNRRYTEFNTLLKEELAWFKAQVYGRSSEKSSSEVSPDQSMLFN